MSRDMSHITPPTLTVLVSTRIDPVSGRPTRSRADAAAAALALQVARHACTAEPLLLTAGAMPEAVARDYLALGIGRLLQLVPAADDATLDPLAALATACTGTALVLTGARAECGLASGALPYALAQRLGWPLVADVIDVQPEPGTDIGAAPAWIVTQALPRGARRRLRLQTAAVLVTHTRLAQREDLPQRHAWQAAQQGRIELRSAAPPNESPAAIAWQPEPARRQLLPLQAATAERGASRMARATGSAGAATSSTATVLRTGSPDEQARALLAYLRERALVAEAVAPAPPIPPTS